MPVDLRPLAGPAPAERAIARPQPSAVFDAPAPEKMAALSARAGREPVVSWTLRRPDGRVATLACDACTAPPAVLRLQEATGAGGVAEFAATVVDPAAGLVEAEVPLSGLVGPGIYLAEVATLAAPDVPAVAEQFYLIVGRSLFYNRRCRGPLTVPEIRLHLRDSSPAENRLLDTLQFDDAELAAAMTRVVDYWNDSMPPTTVHSTRSFPHRYIWLEGTIAGLFGLAAEFYRKNYLPHAAGGVQAQDLNKAAEYEQKAAQKWQEVTAMIRQKKIGENLEACWGAAGSPWGRRGVW